jgi:tetratricopeptide (TPR) repeat protein
VTRPILLALFCVLYAVVLAGPRAVRGREGLDPLDSQGRLVETAIETGRFSDALPVAVTLGKAYPDDPLVHYWLAEIYRGLGETANEIESWESYRKLSASADDACPALARAYARNGDSAKSRQIFEQCAEQERVP